MSPPRGMKHANAGMVGFEPSPQRTDDVGAHGLSDRGRLLQEEARARRAARTAQANAEKSTNMEPGRIRTDLSSRVVQDQDRGRDPLLAAIRDGPKLKKVQQRGVDEAVRRRAQLSQGHGDGLLGALAERMATRRNYISAAGGAEGVSATSESDAAWDED